MPQRTIAAGGGNWNSTSTWVEGAVPTASDFVVGNASSGQLTMNVAGSVQYVDFSAYTQTLTMNANLQTNLASSTSIFGSGMNFAGTAIMNFGSTAQTIIQNTTNRIPYVNFNTGTKTLSTNMYVVNFNAGNQQLNGNTIYVSGNLGDPTSSSDPQQASGTFGTTQIVCDGNGLVSYLCSNNVTITGTYNTVGRGFVFSPQGPTWPTSLTFITGSTTLFNAIYFPSISPLSTENISINTNKNINLFLRNVASNISNFPTRTIIVGPNFDINNLGVWTISRAYTTDASNLTYIFSGGNTNITTLSLSPFTRTTSSQTNPPSPVSGATSYLSPNIQFDRNYTHNITNLLLQGGFTSNSTISSTSSGNKVTLNLGSKITSQIINYNFTDVNASGGQQIVAINGTISNSDNITNVYPSGSGGGGGSFTFVN